MTTYTITTPTNITALASKAGGDTYNVNGGTLTIDCDSRYGLNQGVTTGYLGAVTISSTLGGAVKIDATKVRLIPFTGGSGNVPAASTSIVQGSVTSELLGVWSAINTTPTAAGAAMPASGFIKVRNVVGGAGVYAAGALSGIGATARGADIVGWIEVIGKESTSVIVPRIGSMSVQGAWLSPFDSTGAEIQTSGVAGQSIQLPASVSNSFYSGCWVETIAGSGVYSRWGSANDLVSASLATDERGRFCWISPAGVLRFGSDGTNTVGLVPPSGCRIRVANVLLGSSNSTVGFAANSLPNSTLTTRFFWATSSAGPLTIDIANVAWGFSGPSLYTLSFTNSTFVAPISIVNTTTAFNLSNCIFSQRDVAGATASGNTYSVTSYAPSSNVSDNLFFQYTQNVASSFIVSCSLVSGTFNRNRAHCAMVPTQSAPPGTFSLVLNGSTGDGNESVGGCAFGSLTMVSAKLTNSKLCCWAYGTSAATPTSLIATIGTFKDSVIDGLSWLLSTTDTCQPVTNGGYSIPQLASNSKIRNLGSQTTPLDLGTVHPPASIVSSSFGAVFTGVSVQKVYTTATTGALVNESVQNASFNIENCSSLSATALSLFAANSFVRAVRTPTLAVAAANASGVHWGDFFTSDTVGSINVFMTDAASTTTDQMSITSGTPKFTGGPGLITATAGDQVTWTMKYLAQGHTGLGAPVMTGGTIGNYLVEFRADINDGNGWSAWATANTANLAAVVVNAALGVKLMLRITCLTASTTAITGLRIPTTTTLAAQQAVAYPLDPVTISVTNIVAGSRIKVTRTDTSAVLDNAAVSGTTYSLTGDYTGIPVQVEVRCATPPGPYYQPWVAGGTVLSTGLAFQALQVRDDQ